MRCDAGRVAEGAFELEWMLVSGILAVLALNLNVPTRSSALRQLTAEFAAHRTTCFYCRVALVVSRVE